MWQSKRTWPIRALPWRARQVAVGCLGVLLALATPVGGETRSLFIAANSLVLHPDGGRETSVPFWLDRIARAGGDAVRISGESAFLWDYGLGRAPMAQWSLEGIPPAVPNGMPATAARDGGLMFNAENFVQDRPVDAPYPFGEATATTPLASARALIRGAGADDGRPIYLYVGWTDMAPFAPEFPPSERRFRRYLDAQSKANTAWHAALAAAISTDLPKADVRLIPAATTIARVIRETSLNGVPPSAFFTDNAPHGTPATYFIAALSTYAAVFAAPPPPATAGLTAGLPDVIRDAYPAIRRIVWQEALAQPHAARRATPPPSACVGLNGIADWSTQTPFVNVMKTARPWIGHTAAAWGAYSAEDLKRGGYVDAAGWPQRLPDDATALESFVLTDFPAGATQAAGRYRLTWTGSGRLEVSGRAQNVVRTGEREIRFDFTPGDGPVGIRVTATDPRGTGDPIRDIALVREDLIALLEVGAMFTPAFLASIEGFRCLRFMDWMATNGSSLARWEDRPRPGHMTFAAAGVPVEWMIALANRTGTDPWFNIPHLADDAFVAEFARMLARDLDPRRVARIEFSNELWNFLFPQAEWARVEAQRRWGAAAGDDAWMQAAGVRAAEVMDVFADAVGPENAHRFRRVVAVQTGWPGLEESLLHPRLGPPEGLAAHFDDYAVSGYFGFTIGGEDDRLLAGRPPESWRADELAEYLRTNDIAHLRDDLFPRHAAVASREGLTLTMYEGGLHMVAGDAAEDPAARAFLDDFAYSPAVAALYRDAFAAWRAAGGRAFNAFVDTAAPNRHGNWGARRWLGDDNPRIRALLEENARPLPDDLRRGRDFTAGVTRSGSPGNDVLDGTGQADVLLGGDGDDTLRARGAGDRLHGGPGTDTAIIRAARSEVTFEWVGDILTATTPEGPVYLYSVEKIRLEP